MQPDLKREGEESEDEDQEEGAGEEAVKNRAIEFVEEKEGECPLAYELFKLENLFLELKISYFMLCDFRELFGTIRKKFVEINLSQMRSIDISSHKVDESRLNFFKKRDAIYADRNVLIKWFNCLAKAYDSLECSYLVLKKKLALCLEADQVHGNVELERFQEVQEQGQEDSYNEKFKQWEMGVLALEKKWARQDLAKSSKKFEKLCHTFRTRKNELVFIICMLEEKVEALERECASQTVPSGGNRRQGDNKENKNSNHKNGGGGRVCKACDGKSDLFVKLPSNTKKATNERFSKRAWR